MTDLIAVLVIVFILSLVVLYIIRSKKQGAKCIGCPMSKNCSANKCGCSNQKKT